MIEAAAQIRLPTEPRAVFELILDLSRYKEIDHKITKIYSNPPLGEDSSGIVEFRGKMRGFPGPRQREIVELDRWRSLTFTSDGPWLTDRLMHARGGFEVIEEGDGWCTIEHRYVFDFKGPAGLFMDRFCGRWLLDDLQEELQRLQRHFADERG